MKTNIIQKLQKGDNATIHNLYQNHFASCHRFIVNNRGNQEDAKDIFQEAIVILITNAQKEGFKLSVATGTYLYAIVRNLWCKRLKKEQKSGLALILDHPDYHIVLEEEESTLEAKQLKEEKHDLIATLLKENMKEDCRKVLEAFYFQKKSMKEIAQMMGYTTQFARVKKNRSLNYLRRLVHKHYLEAA